MKLGTKSLLLGAHQVILHPLLIARAWRKLYGFPFDPRLWIAFIVHDWGYWGKPDMDGPEGKTHPELGGRIMEFLFGKKWGDFCRYHSKSYAKLKGVQFSRLCVADKLVLSLEWRRFYLWRTAKTGELAEYMGDGWFDSKKWFDSSQRKLKNWAKGNVWAPEPQTGAELEKWFNDLDEDITIIRKGVSVPPTTHIDEECYRFTRRTYPSKGSIFMVGSAEGAGRLRSTRIDPFYSDELGVPWSAGGKRFNEHIKPEVLFPPDPAGVPREQTVFHIHPDGVVTGRVGTSPPVTIHDGTTVEGLEQAKKYIDEYNKGYKHMNKRFETIWFKLLWRRYYRHMWE